MEREETKVVIGLDTLIDLAEEPGVGVCLWCNAPLTPDEFGVCRGCAPERVPMEMEKGMPF